mgnify:CR=1 FL=1
MEIVKKAVISVNGKSEEVEAVIDTGADRTMVDEEILLKLAAPHLGNWGVQSMGEFKDTKPVYSVGVEVDGVVFPLTVFGGRKNIIGHDFLQLAKAAINEETGEVKLTKDWVEM